MILRKKKVADIKKRVEDIIDQIKPDKSMNVASDEDLFGTGILDSFGMIEYIGALEKTFDIKMSNEDLIPQSLWSIEATVETIKKYMFNSNIQKDISQGQNR